MKLSRSARRKKTGFLPKTRFLRLSPTRLVLLFGLLTVGCTAQSAELTVTSVPAVTSVAATRVSAPTEVGTTPVAEATLAPPPTATAVAVATETEVVTAAAEPTATPLPTDTPQPQAALTYGLTEEGAYVVGFPDAPVTMIDYSDFL
ncbi:MAG: hypothetical protein M9941_02755 [Anaerolineae bacterium]|nr:hypothetical protein [Anaerolineae bacterium]MCO5196657.1 hypothetical protein [Anaerolineae bacterium]